jgi:hypothetical protein
VMRHSPGLPQTFEIQFEWIRGDDPGGRLVLRARLGGVAHHRCTRWDVPRHHAARPDDGIVPDADAGQDNRPSSDPDILPDADRVAL